MIVTPHRTKIFSEAETVQHEQTVPGMAHFAATGPSGTMCFMCRHWNNGDLLTIGRRVDGWLRPYRCGKFSALTDLLGPDVPPATPSCRHFEPHGFALSLVIEPKKAKP